jgi:hypothetical protein
MQAQLAAVTARVEILELALTAVPTPRRQDADRRADRMPTEADTHADTAPTDADTPPFPRRPGRRPSPLRQRILTLLGAHPAGLSAEELRVYLKPQKPLGDTLQGMVRQGLLVRQGDRKGGRYLPARTP